MATLQLRVCADVHCEASYYNEQLSVWEPLLEPLEDTETGRLLPWSLSVEVWMYRTHIVHAAHMHTHTHTMHAAHMHTCTQPMHTHTHTHTRIYTQKVTYNICTCTCIMYALCTVLTCMYSTYSTVYGMRVHTFHVYTHIVHVHVHTHTPIYMNHNNTDR